MAIPSSRPAALLGIAALILSLPACAAPALPSRCALPPPTVPQLGVHPHGPSSSVPPGSFVEDSVALAEWGDFLESQAQGQSSVLQRVLDGQGEPAFGAPSCWDRLCDNAHLTLADYGHYWSWENIGLLAGGVAAMAPVANTTADEDIRRWYQRGVHGRGLNRLAEVANIGGQVWIVAPLALEGMGLLGKVGEDYRSDDGLYEWSNRSLRAVAVGYPPVVMGYGLLGASRPDRGLHKWQPFRNFHGVSGHTFLGTVPFLTAAAMTDNPWVKYPLLLGSLLSGWSRIHEDRHYFSQVALGWWMAYLAVRSVNQTEEARGVSLTPYTPAGPGVGVEVRY